MIEGYIISEQVAVDNNLVYNNGVDLFYSRQLKTGEWWCDINCSNEFPDMIDWSQCEIRWIDPTTDFPEDPDPWETFAALKAKYLNK